MIDAAAMDAERASPWIIARWADGAPAERRPPAGNRAQGIVGERALSIAKTGGLEDVDRGQSGPNPRQQMPSKGPSAGSGWLGAPASPQAGAWSLAGPGCGPEGSE